MERKDSIRRFLREQFRDDKKPKEHKEKNRESKDSKKSKENREHTATASNNSIPAGSTEPIKNSNSEVKSKSSAYRLFRTVSRRNPNFIKLFSYKFYQTNKFSFYFFNN